jgi:hypothetical protein
MMVGGLLIVLCRVAYVAEIAPLRERISARRSSIGELHTAPTALPKIPAIQTPTEQLEVFYTFFPDDNVVPTVLERLFAAAARENLSLPQGDYQVVKESSGRLTRYGISLPLKGPYLGLRRFIALSLQETPALSLQGVSFIRQAAGDASIDAQVRLVLYVRTEIP